MKMTSLADTMANIGHPMTDEEVIDYILAGLGPGHSDLFTAIADVVVADTMVVVHVVKYVAFQATLH